MASVLGESRNVYTLAIRRDRGEAGGDDEAEVGKSTQFLNGWANSRASYTGVSRIVSALSTRIICCAVMNDRRGAKLVMFFIPAPMTVESRLRKLTTEVGNLSQQMNLRWSTNFCTICSWWRAVNATAVFPVPPAPTRALGVSSSGRQISSSIRVSRPMHARGGGGGDSPGPLRRDYS